MSELREYDMQIHSNPRADAWAKFYKETFPESDEGLMIGWFANAMMAMHDSLHKNKVEPLEKERDELLKQNADIMYAINFAMGEDFPIDFWKLWSEGEFQVIKKEWPHFDGYLGDQG